MTLIDFTKDQLSIIETSLKSSLKYADSEYDMDDMFYDYEFCSIAEEKDDIFYDINNTGGKY